MACLLVVFWKKKSTMWMALHCNICKSFTPALDSPLSLFQTLQRKMVRIVVLISSISQRLMMMTAMCQWSHVPTPRAPVWARVLALHPRRHRTTRYRAWQWCHPLSPSCSLPAGAWVLPSSAWTRPLDSAIIKALWAHCARPVQSRAAPPHTASKCPPAAPSCPHVPLSSSALPIRLTISEL